METLLAFIVGPLLWLIGAVAFDGVHWVLHRMLRSRFRLMRALARPHAIHHEWIDRDLETHWELRTANIWCHIVPEYLTQLVFTAAVAWLLPLPFAAVLFGLQTLVFIGILRYRGRDVNHRPRKRIDAHAPGWRTPPAYHLLHHAWPDSHFSAYGKLVDWLVGGGAQIAERRFGWRGGDSSLKSALADALGRAGARVEFEFRDLARIDVLVLGDPGAPLLDDVEGFIEATRDRQLPPEIWAFRTSAEDPFARHYHSDPRVVFRTLLLPQPPGLDALPPSVAQNFARRVLFWVRRDAHFLALERPLAWSAMRRFVRTVPSAPREASGVQHRMDFVSSA